MRRNFLVPWAIVALLMVGAWTSRGLASPLTQPTSPPSGPLLPPVATELIGQIGGATYALDSSGPYVYLGVGPRVLVLCRNLIKFDRIESVLIVKFGTTF